MDRAILSGRRAVITGGSRGFGAAIAWAFADAGCDLVLVARDERTLFATARNLSERFPERSITTVVGDISAEGDVDRCAARAGELGGADIVVCNAGVHGPIGPIESAANTAADWIAALRINVGGTFLCARAFAEQLKASVRGKLIVLSGGGATKPMANMTSYSASKAAVVRLAETIAVEWQSFGIDVNAVAPGAMNTRMLDNALAAGPQLLGQREFDALLRQKEGGGAPLDRGAALCTFLASRQSDGITGRLISAIWDPWERLGQLRQSFETTDVYTLRRIVPADRGLHW